MERIQKDQRLDCLQKIEKAIGNAEKTFQSHANGSSHASEGISALEQAKQELERAWSFHLGQHNEHYFG